MPPTDTVPVTPPPKSRFLNGKILAIIGAIVVVVIVVVVILLPKPATQRQQTSNQQKTQQKSYDTTLLGEEYSNTLYGVSVAFPKGWQKGEKSQANPYSVVNYENPQIDAEGNASGHAGADLSIQSADEELEAYMRRIIEASLNASLNSKLLEHKDVVVNDQKVRMISYEIPNQSGVKARFLQYVFVKNKRFYDLSFHALSSKWDNYEAAFEASVKSLEIT